MVWSVVLWYGETSTTTGGEASNVGSDPCPKGCVCTAQRVDCSNLNLTTIPSDIGPKTSIL